VVIQGKHKNRCNFKFTDQSIWGIIIILLCIAGLYIYSLGPSISSDSSSYLNMRPHRSLGYPFFLWLFALFGNYQIKVVIAVQIAINIISFIYLLKNLYEVLNIKLENLLFIIPLIIYFIIYEIQPNKIMSESLAFPIFIWTSISIINYIYYDDIKEFVYIIISLVLLVLIRGQFIFIYPVLFLLSAIILMRTKNIKLFIYSIILIIISFFGARLINNSYHYVVHGEFNNTPFTSFNLITNVLYSYPRESVIDIQINDYQVEAIKTAKMKMDSEILSYNSFIDSLKINRPDYEITRTDIAFHYSESFNDILYRTILPIFSKTNNPLSDFSDYKNLNNHFSEVSIYLLKKDPKPFIRLMFIDIFVNGFGNRLFLTLFGTVFIITLYNGLKGYKFDLVVNIFFLAHLSNVLLVSIGGRVAPRFTMYTLFMICLLLFIYILSKRITDKKVL